MTSFSLPSPDPRTPPMVLLNIQTIPRMLWHQMVHCSHHPHHKTSQAAPWRHSRVTLKPPRRHPLQTLLYFTYPPHSLYLHLNLNYINDSSMLYRMTPSPLPKRNQQPHIHGTIVYYYTILLYTYLKLFTSMFYTCTMMIVSPVTSVSQEHLNYYLTITDSLRCLLMSSNMFLLV